MKIIANLLITKDIRNDEDIKQYTNDVFTYIHNVDKLYIYNITKYDLSKFYEAINRFDKIEYTNMTDMGEVANYELIYDNAAKENADYSVILELGYSYESDAFSTMTKYLHEHDLNDVAVITPIPLYGCQLHERKTETVRYVGGGCKLIGAFVNMNIYKELNGFKKEYYQSTFDYEYCIRARLKGYRILLFNNEVLRNINYRIVEKRILFTTLSTYDKDPLDIYYEYRNRLFLWDEYKELDPYYVNLDKKLAKRERHEMKMRDPGYRDKLVMFEKAKEDYKKGKMGKIKYEKKEERF